MYKPISFYIYTNSNSSDISLLLLICDNITHIELIIFRLAVYISMKQINKTIYILTRTYIY